MTALRAAINLGLRSIVVPAMSYDGNLPVSGRAFLRVIRELDGLMDSSDFSIEDTFVVRSNRRDIEYLRSHVESALYR